jgi:hypothetical protein
VRATVLTAVYDGYDRLAPACPQIGIDVDWVCVTDDPDLEVDGWRVEHKPRALLPRMAAKLPKLYPCAFTDAPASVWIDAACAVTSPTFVADVLDYAWPLAMFPHPERDCLYDEAAVVPSLARFNGAPIDRQAASYRRGGFPEHWGLWAATVIARRHTADMSALSGLWHDEMDAWHDQHDQHTFAYAARTVGVRPRDLPGTHTANPWLTHAPSVRHHAA